MIEEVIMMNHEIEQKTKFSQERLLHNIFSLIKQQNLKIGEVEKNSGLSVGYLSRLTKSENSFPTVETVWRIAKTLGVSLEWLIEGSGARGNHHAEYLIQFMSRLYDQTRDDQMDWGRYRTTNINDMLLNGAPKDFPVIVEGKCSNDPTMMTLLDFDQYSMMCNSELTRYISPVSRRKGVAAIAGSCFYTDLSEVNRLYLIRYVEHMMIDWDEKNRAAILDLVHWYELFTVNRQDFSVLPMCNNLNENDVLTPAFEKLYDELDIHQNDVRINPGVRSIIDQYMEKTAPIQR